MLQLQKSQNILFKAVLLINELYIKLYFFFFKPKIILKGYYRSFLLHEKEFIIRTLNIYNLNKVHNFLNYSIKTNSPDFIMPHKTDLRTLKIIFKRASHIPLGIFYKDALIGYALIRLLFPKKGSYAIFISDEWQGKGIGTAALEKQLVLINELKFRPYSAVNKRNLKSLKMLKKLKIEFGNDFGDYFVTKDVIRK